MSTAVFCIAPTKTIANTIVDRLKMSKFNNNDISVLFPDSSKNSDIAHDIASKLPEGTVTGVGTGGVVGGALGLLAGLGLLAIPGAGPFIAAGPIMAALSGMAVGGTVGGITGGLIGYGIPEIEAKVYESRIKEGHILISVHTNSSEEVTQVKEIFEAEHATDISSGSETAHHPGATAKV